MRYSLLLLALLIAGMNLFVSKELNFLLICGVLFITLSHDKAIVYKSSFNILWPVLLLSGIGILAGIISLGSIGKDFYRDIFLFLGVFVYFIGGVQLSKYIKDFDTLFKGFSFIVVVSSIIHIGLVITNFDHVGSLQQYRLATGMTSINEAIYLSFFFARLFNQDMRRLIPTLTTINKIIVIIILLSFLLYFSRTMIITLVVLTFFLSDFINVRYFFSSRNKRLPYVALFVMLMYFSSGFLVSLLPPNGHIASLVTKFESITEEVFWNEKNSYAADLSDINNNWRGYEAAQGLKMYSNGSDLQKLFGHGFGTLVDLGIRIKLAGKDYEKVPILHNGYVLLLVKCGISGLVLYLLFLYKIGFSKVKKILYEDLEQYYCYQMLSGLSVVVLLNTITMTGMFSQGSAIIPIFVGLFIGINKRKELDLIDKTERPLYANASHNLLSSVGK